MDTMATQYQMAYFQGFFLTSIPRKNLAQITIRKSRHRFVTRRKANNKVLETPSRVDSYEKTIWSHDYIEGSETNLPVKELEEKVAEMIIESENGGLSTSGLLELVDNIERLGLGYRFQPDITRILNKIVATSENNFGREEEDNLYVISLKYRLLRQHGYSVSSQDFGSLFKDRHGDAIACLQTDAKTLLSIYEASYLALEGEIDLHEAKLFANENLLELNGHENNVMINHALDIPLYRRMLRSEARWYIDAYGKRKDANQLLLELAILDFNLVQSAHKADLQEVSSWWETIGLASKLSFIRDRLMECFFYCVGVVFEPQYSSCRVGITKVCTIITTIDDIYDVYGSLDELEVFTNAVKRWDIKAVNYMPEYLQLAFLALYNTVNAMGYDTLIAQGKNIIPILAKMGGELSESFFVEAKWSHSSYMPTLDEYLDNAWRSASGPVILTHGYFLMNQHVNDVIECLEKCHDLFKWSSMILRLCNDLTTPSDEIERGKSVDAISCYMHERGICEDAAREYTKTLIDKAWMKMIEARIACSEYLEHPLIDMAINLGRVSHCTYQYGDGIKAPEARANYQVMSVIIEPITSKILGK